MAKRYIDSDVIVRLITGDDLGKQQRSRGLLQRVAEGSESAGIAASTVGEVIYVLTSPRLYRLSRARARGAMLIVLETPHLHVENRATVLRALDLYAIAMPDFGDAMLVATMEREGATDVISFDRGYDRIAGITRREP